MKQERKETGSTIDLLSKRIERIENSIGGLTARVVLLETSMEEFMALGMRINQTTQESLGAYTTELNKIRAAIERFEALAVLAEGRA
jgi:mevalonate kinase